MAKLVHVKNLTEEEIITLNFDKRCQITDCEESNFEYSASCSLKKTKEVEDNFSNDSPEKTHDDELSKHSSEISHTPGKLLIQKSPAKKTTIKSPCSKAQSSSDEEVIMRQKQKRKMNYKQPSNSSVESTGLPSLPTVGPTVEVSSVNVQNTATPQILYIPPNQILKDVKNNVTFYLVPQGINQPNVITPTAKVLKLNPQSLPKEKSAHSKSASVLPVSMNAPNTVNDPQTVFIPIGANIAEATKNVTSIFAPQGKEKNTKDIQKPTNIVTLKPFALQEQRVAPSVTTLEDVVDILYSSNPFTSPKKIQQTVSKPSGIETLNKLPLPETKISEPVITPVATLVFFDLETTGLGYQIGAANVQITEITMIAMSRKEFHACQTADLKNVRVINKLSMCTKPRSFVSSGAAKVTGLDDYKLREQNHFDKDTAEIICMFLRRLPKPVCLLAHNGDRYDYPLIKAEFQRLNMNLPSDVVTADTLAAFREIGLPDEISVKVPSKTKNGRQSFSLESIHLHFFKRKPTGGHSSEGDCLALAKVCHKVKDNFLTWIDANTHSFELVSPMW